MAFKIGVDMGGTFVDGILMNKDSGALYLRKEPSTPASPVTGIMQCLAGLAEDVGLPLHELLRQTTEIVHGTTAVDNALINRTLPRTGLITTRGFKWTVPLMCAGRPFHEDQQQTHKSAAREATAWVPAYRISEVAERVDYEGTVLVPLDLDDVAAAVRYLVDEQQVEAIAVCLLWSFRNPAHEEAIAAWIGSHYPQVPVSVSSRIVPVMREYERSVTTILDCFIGRILRSYVEALGTGLRAEGYDRSLYLMQSSGGVMAVGNGARQPLVHAWNSGPTGGVLGAKFVGDLLGHRHILSLDMGGTSTDVSLIKDGALEILTRPKVHGYTTHLPVLDIISIGAGGGSIAWADYGPLLKVGPKSAGADPGPACYGRGGVAPTVTDANVVLGYINPDTFLGGRMRLGRDLAMAAVGRLAAQLDLEVVATATGINRVCNSNMVNAMRAVSVERGSDPRHALLMCFGGAGPAHGAFLMDALGIRQTLIPLTATVHSAFGFLSADVSYYFSLTDVMIFPGEVRRLNAAYARLEEQGRAALAAAGVSAQRMSFLRSADLRYRGQVWEVTVPLPDGELTGDSPAAVLEAFERRYETLYGAGSAWRQSGVEFVNFHVRAVGWLGRPRLAAAQAGTRSLDAAARPSRPAFFPQANQFVETRIFDGARLAAGMELAGPAIVESTGTTIVIPPGKRGTVDEYGNMLIENGG